MKLQPAQANPWIQVNWDWRATGNFVGGGIGAGLLAAAGLLALRGVPPAPLAIAGVLAVLAGLASVSLEIGRPLRAINVLRHPARSWMSREALLAPVLAAAGLLAAWRGGPWPGVAAVLALAYLYCQSRILQSAKGVPAWREPRIRALLVLSGLVEGTGAALPLALLAAPDAAPGWFGPGVLAILVVLRAAAWRRYHDALARAGMPSATAAALARFRPRWLLLGHALPLALLLAAMVGGASVAMAWVAAIGGACATLAGIALKAMLVNRAGHVQGFALARTPARGAGTAGPPVRPGWS